MLMLRVLNLAHILHIMTQLPKKTPSWLLLKNDCYYLFFRFYGQTFAFSLVSLGNTPMPGPLTISYSDSIGQPSTGNRTMLLHWNPSKLLYNMLNVKLTEAFSQNYP